MDTLCKGCAYLPPDFPEKVRACLGIGEVSWVNTLRRALESTGIELEEFDSGVAAVELGSDQLPTFCERVRIAFREEAWDQIRVAINPINEHPSLGELLRGETLTSFIERVEGAWLVELLRESRLHAVFQPIVDLSSRQIFGHECLMRGESVGGETIMPLAMLDAARRGGLAFHLDRAARITAIQDAAQAKLPGRIFINFNPATIYDPDLCLHATMRSIIDSGIAPERFVFEVIESERIDSPAHLRRIVDFYRKKGFGFALDDLGSGYNGLNLLSEMRPDYVKLDRTLIGGIDGDPYRQQVVRHLLDLARAIGVRTVVEGIERPEEMAWATEHGADYGQGYLLGRPGRDFVEPVPPSHGVSEANSRGPTSSHPRHKA